MTSLATMAPAPVVLSMSSSDEVDDDVAFKVLNQDNLPITIIGEGFLKPFGRTAAGQKQKPNGIVYPTRRIDALSTNLTDNKQKSFTKSNGYIDVPAPVITSNRVITLSEESATNNYNLKKNISASHGCLVNHNTNNSAAKSRSHHDLLHEQLDRKFTRTLDAKLKKLQKDEKQHNHRKPHQPLSTYNNDSARKPFVTTVKKGQFLEPPAETAGLIGFKVVDDTVAATLRREHKKLYAYYSKPRVLNRSLGNNGHKSRCDAAAKAAGLTGQFTNVDGAIVNVNSYSGGKNVMDVLPYSNIMFEKRVYRGSNFAPPMPCHVPKWNPNCSNAKLLSYNQGDGESAAARAAEARRRALARRRAKNQQVRAAQLRLGSPPPVPGRKHEPVQTDDYLEELFNNPPVTDICTQTDLFLERPISPFYVPAKTGQDAETQIYPGDLFDFDLEVQPILEVLVGKTIEQALIEVLEEEELAALREQQRRFLELRAAESSEAQRLEERERRLTLEKNRRMRDHEKGLSVQKEMEERIAASVMLQGYIADLLPNVLEGLESEGVLTDNIKQDIDDSFMPWLMKEVTSELEEMVSSRDILQDIVREILENRAELYRALYKESASDESEEEGPTHDDILLQDHLKLQNEISKNLNQDKSTN